MLHALCASEPVLFGDALRLCVDAGLAGGKVAEDFNGVIVAALVGVDPVESCERKGKVDCRPRKGMARTQPASWVTCC